MADPAGGSHDCESSRGRRRPRSGAEHRAVDVGGYAACAWMAVFAAVHVYWGVGGRVGLPAEVSLSDNTALFVIDLVAVPLCLVGSLLALALVRPWGRRFGRNLLLAAAWGTCALLLAHAVPAVIDGVLMALGVRSAELSPADRFSLFLYEPYWLLGGILFGLAARSFGRQLRDGLVGE